MTLTLVPSADQHHTVSSRTVTRWLRSLGALGWPAQYVADQCGYGKVVNQAVRFGSFPAEFARRIEEFYLDHRDQPATPRTGLTGDQISKARHHARRRGWLTPDWYDDDGNVLTATEYRRRRSIAYRHARAYDAIEILVLLVNRLSDSAISERLRWCTAEHVGHLRRRARLSGEFTYEVWHPDAPSLVRLKEIERALDAYLADPDADPHLTLYNLGLVADRKRDAERARRQAEEAANERIAS